MNFIKVGVKSTVSEVFKDLKDPKDLKFKISEGYKQNFHESKTTVSHLYLSICICLHVNFLIAFVKLLSGIFDVTQIRFSS